MDNPAAERLRTALALFEAGVEMMRQNLRREFPEADEKEIDAKLAAWLQHRPGAEYGDCEGRPVDPAVRFSRTGGDD
ncbi:MAG TPA: hypothetical protein VJ725_19605 [Thermoanaerobaculia bacterium]|nr:hypothetical protein [Thermoanaerobaculia bacterium]